MMKVMADRKAASNLWQTVLIGSFMLWPLVLLDERVTQFITGKERVNHLRIESIEFRDGYFRQLVLPERGGLKRAAWSAAIYSGPLMKCGGSGASPYGKRTEPAVFTADEWTGGDCSGLVPGQRYEARASWGYWGSDGQHYEVNSTFHFTYSEPEK